MVVFGSCACLRVLEGQSVSWASCYLAWHLVDINKEQLFDMVWTINDHHGVFLRDLPSATMAMAQVELCSGQHAFLDTPSCSILAVSARGGGLQSSHPAENLHCGLPWWVLRDVFAQMVWNIVLWWLAKRPAWSQRRLFQCVPPLAQQPLFLPWCNVKLCNQGYSMQLKWLLGSCLGFLAKQFPASSILVWIDYLAKNICEGAVINFFWNQQVSWLEQFCSELSAVLL